jgi:ribose/xylose/arabinose/galactoside ABC-type transport system permease subunit
MSTFSNPKGDPVAAERERVSVLRSASDQIVQMLPVIVLILVLLVLSLAVPYFLTVNNVINILLQSSAMGLMSIGMTVVLIVGGIDLSMPAMMGFAAILGVMYMRDGGNPILAGLIMVGVATAGGVINGFAVAHLRMIPFVVTLSTQAVAMGASLAVTKAISVAGINPRFVDTVLGKVWIIPVPVLFVIAVMVAAQFVMRDSLYGRWLYAVGVNGRAARVAGVPTRTVNFLAYVFAGFMAGAAAIVLSSRLGSASAAMGQSSVVLDIVGSAVLGGASIYGGVGTAVGAVIGATILTLLSNAMNLMHVSYYTTLLIKGVVIIAVIALDSLRRQ